MSPPMYAAWDSRRPVVVAAADVTQTSAEVGEGSARVTVRRPVNSPPWVETR